MLKIRNTVDLNELVDRYGFEIGIAQDNYLVYCDHSGNEILVYPFADRLIQLLISPMCSTCENKSNDGRRIDISNSGAMDLITRLFEDNKIYIQEEK